MEARQKITVEQAASELDRSMESLDELRAAHLGESLKVEGAKGNVYVREHARLLGKYGKGHPRTLDIEARMKANQMYQAAIVTEYHNASTPRPQPSKGWALDGFVRSTDGRPVHGVTVGLYDRANMWQQSFGHACTDKDGYFSLRVDTLPEKPTSPLFVRAAKERRILPSRDLPVLPKAGATKRVEIILGEQNDKKEDCLPPDGQITPMSTPPEIQENEKPATKKNRK